MFKTNREDKMHIWEEEKQTYMKACMERGTEDQREALKKALDEIDFSI